jgi:lactoylglutathione lyase
MTQRTAIRSLVLVVATSLSVASLSAQTAPQRPHITGISHVAYWVSDIPKALKFWHDFLGFNEFGSTRLGSRVTINDHQYIEMLRLSPQHPNRMAHLCFLVDDLPAMRAYLVAKGIKVEGDAKFYINIHDPDGTSLRFQQTGPNGFSQRIEGFAAASEAQTRISNAIFHVGFIVGNAEKSVAFYRDILGFQETWRGSSNGTELSWINMQVPGDADYIELMLYNKVPGNYGSSNHTSLVVADMQQAVDILKTRAAAAGYTRPLEIREGKNHKRQVNLFDPDGTRVELMEPHTVDGKPAPSSTAPPPLPAHD